MEKDEKFDEPRQVPPKAETEETTDDEETCFIHKNPRHFIFGAGLFVIVAIFYSHLNSLRIDIQKCNEKIQMLQTENEDLRIILREIQKAASKSEIDQQISEDWVRIAENDLHQMKIEDFFDSAPRKPPSTKTVWLGSDTDKVEILDKKYELPDYCHKAEENDLFFEYIQEKCDQKRRKLVKAKKAKELKMSKTQKNNKKKEWNEKNYDDYIQETLKSFNVEIEEIKKKRTEAAEKMDPLENSKFSQKKQRKIGENPPTSEYLPETSGGLKKTRNLQEKQEFSSNESFSEKPSKPKRKKQKRKDRNWLEDRTNGREEARNLQDENNNVNWYLNRKNERELDRLQV